MADLLDKVKQGIDKGVNVVSVRSREALDTVRLKGRIGSLADRKRDALEELGSVVYAVYLEDPGACPGQAQAKCEELAGLDAEIKAREEELRTLHQEAKRELGIPLCAGCGGELAEDDKFCRRCGRQAEA